MAVMLSIREDFHKLRWTMLQHKGRKKGKTEETEKTEEIDMGYTNQLALFVSFRDGETRQAGDS